jgi:hypothetical protein
MYLENYQAQGAYQPSGPTIALDLLATATTTSGTLTGGLYHIASSVYSHFSMDTAYEIQSISNIVLTAGVSYTLTVGAVVLTSGALGASPVIGDLVTALQGDADYAAAPFTIAANGSAGILVTWKAFGSQSDTAALTDDVPTAYTTTTVTEGGAEATVNNGMLAAGERVLVVPNGVFLSFVKSTGVSDGVIRITQCE